MVLSAQEQLAQMQQQMVEMQKQMVALQAQAAREAQSVQKPVDLAVPPTIAPEPVRAQAATDVAPGEDAEHQNYIKHLAELSKEQRDAEIAKFANPAALGKSAAGVVTANLNAEVDALNKIQPYDKVVGGFIQNNASTTSAFNADGYQGQRSSVQQNLPILPEGTGALFGNAAINQDKDLKVKSADFGLNYATPVKKLGDVDLVGIANLNINFPSEGNFDAKNVSGLGGVVIKPHEGTDRANYTLAALLNGEGQVSGLGRVSKELYKADDLTATGYAQGVYDVTNSKLNSGGGVRVDYDIGNGNSIYSNTFLGVNDVFNKPEFTGTEQVGVAWGGAPKKSETERNFEKISHTNESSNLVAHNSITASSNQPSVESIVKPEANTSTISAASNSSHAREENDPMREASNKYFSLEGKKQDQFVDRLASNVAKNTGMNAEGAKDYLLNRFEEYQNQNDQVAQR